MSTHHLTGSAVEQIIGEARIEVGEEIAAVSFVSVLKLEACPVPSGFGGLRAMEWAPESGSIGKSTLELP